MQKYISQKEMDPIKDREKYRENRKSIKKKDKDRAALIEFFKKYHMTIQLSLSFDIPKKELFDDEMKEILSFIDAELASMGVDSSTLDPYCPDGFAVKGEIDYKAEQC